MKNNRVLIIEDHPIVANSIRDVLAQVFAEDLHIDITGNMLDAINSIKSINYRIVIADLTLDDKKFFKHIELCKLRQIPCLIFSASTQYSIIKECLNRGASGYVMKSSKMIELQQAILAVLKKTQVPFLCNRSSSTYSSSEVMDGIKQEIPKPILSATEEAVLKLIMDGRRINEIAEVFSNSPNTIKKHRHNMIQNNNCTIDNIIKRYLFWNGIE